MNGFAHRIVATKRERHVRNAAGNQCVRQFTFDVFTRADKVLCVIVVLFNASCDREDVRVEDDIFSREANLFGEDFVRPTANLDFPCAGIGLALFVKSHYHYCRTVATQQFRVMDKGVDTLFHRDRVNNAFALDTLQTFFNNVPF
ncbi:hypothetical protein ExPUPEC129_03320 [Escherichia coli]|nr:hypothetical protein ExPCM15_03123 [Escherichia coli]GCN59348.1 hypothetical protein ExPCM1_04221 [Escherichia coli]GDW85362.1 hypothetical protein ExPUPEC129_03320 [Escherichia coli]